VLSRSSNERESEKDSILRINFCFILLLAVFFVFCSETHAETESETESLQISGQAFVGEKAPWLSGWTMSGDVFNIDMPFKDKSTKRLVLVFWTTWCIPCRRGMSMIEGAADTLNKSGSVVVMVNFGEGREMIRKYLKKYSVSFPVVLDRYKRTEKTYLSDVKNNKVSLPKTVIIDPDRKVKAIFGREGDDYIERILSVN